MEPNYGEDTRLQRRTLAATGAFLIEGEAEGVNSRPINQGASSAECLNDAKAQLAEAIDHFYELYQDGTDEISLEAVLDTLNTIERSLSKC